MGQALRSKGAVKSTSSRAKRLAEKASGEKAVQSFRIPDRAPRLALIAFCLMTAVFAFGGAKWTLGKIASDIAERRMENTEQRESIAIITDLCMQPVMLEDFANCYGPDCRLLYTLAIGNIEWRDALMRQEDALQRSCRSVRHWAIKRGSSPSITTAQARVP